MPAAQTGLNRFDESDALKVRSVDEIHQSLLNCEYIFHCRTHSFLFLFLDRLFFCNFTCTTFLLNSFSDSCLRTTENLTRKRLTANRMRILWKLANNFIEFTESTLCRPIHNSVCLVVVTHKMAVIIIVCFFLYLFQWFSLSSTWTLVCAHISHSSKWSSSE